MATFLQETWRRLGESDEDALVEGTRQMCDQLTASKKNKSSTGRIKYETKAANGQMRVKAAR